MLDTEQLKVRTFVAVLEDRLEVKRRALERANTDQDTTNFLRGQVKNLRWVLAQINGEHENDGD